MRTYVVNEKEFTTICSVHDEVTGIILNLLKEDLPGTIQSSLQNIRELVSVAKEMGQNMEDAIKYKNIITNTTVDFYSFQRFLYNNSIEEDLE